MPHVHENKKLDQYYCIFKTLHNVQLMLMNTQLVVVCSCDTELTARYMISSVCEAYYKRVYVVEPDMIFDPAG